MTQVTTQNLINECDGNVTELVETPVVVYITVKTTDLNLTWDTDETYRLDVQSKGWYQLAVTCNKHSYEDYYLLSLKNTR